MRELYYTPDLRRTSMKDNNQPLNVEGNNFLQTKVKTRQVSKIIKMPLVTPNKNKEQHESGTKTLTKKKDKPMKYQHVKRYIKRTNLNVVVKHNFVLLL